MDSGEQPQPRAAAGAQGAQHEPRLVARWIWVLEHAQDVVMVTVGVVLVVLAAALLIGGIVDALNGGDGPISSAGPVLLDRVLLVLILVEIVHTVVLTLRAHRLVAQPFIVVGLIAVIRRILVVFTPESHLTASVPELALLIGMVAVFVAALIAVSAFENGGESGLPGRRAGRRGGPPLPAGLEAGQRQHDGNGENPPGAPG